MKSPDSRKAPVDTRQIATFPPGFKLAACLLALCLAVAVGTAWRGWKSVPQIGSRVHEGIVENSGRKNYFTRGQWKADARTLVAVVHYLLQAEPDWRTNQIALASAFPLEKASAGFAQNGPSNQLAGPIGSPSRGTTNPPARI